MCDNKFRNQVDAAVQAVSSHRGPMRSLTVLRANRPGRLASRSWILLVRWYRSLRLRNRAEWCCRLAR